MIVYDDMKFSIMMKQYSLKHLVLSIFLVCISGRIHSQDTGSIGFFDSDEILEVTLETDFKNLISEKREGKYQPASLIIKDNSYAIRVKTRGNFRLENCGFPPIFLNFSKTEFAGNTNENLKKIKLVNACKMQDSYTKLVLREYQIYRAYNLMTDKSFKVRLLKITYVDTSKKMKPVTQNGFVIEEDKMMAERLDGMIIKRKHIRDQSCNLDEVIMLSIFQFMIGNTDWQIANLQNMRLVKLTDAAEPKPYAIPYDFDYTGIVNASYAIPADILGIESVRERLYWGKCYPEEDIAAAIERFYNNKDAIYQLYQNFTLFDKGSLKYSLSYLNSFYKIIEDEKRWKRYFIARCQDD
jgi:hypothetical protein